MNNYSKICVKGPGKTASDIINRLKPIKDVAHRNIDLCKCNPAWKKLGHAMIHWYY